MQFVFAALIVAGLLPFGLALRANRGASLLHAVGWALIAWLSWGITFVVGDGETTAMDPARYCGLCLTGCVGVAVLGARRPHEFAWNFVVLGLFFVMVLPLLETLFIGTHPIDGLRISFLAATLAVGILNYLPTRLGLAAMVMMMVGAGEITLLYSPDSLQGLHATLIVDLTLMGIPWIAWICWMRRRDGSEFDRQWLDFRDRWGLVWSQRVREQFNHASENAGLPVQLTWRGLRSDTGTLDVDRSHEEKSLEILRAILQRFIARA